MAGRAPVHGHLQRAGRHSGSAYPWRLAGQPAPVGNRRNPVEPGHCRAGWTAEARWRRSRGRPGHDPAQNGHAERIRSSTPGQENPAIFTANGSFSPKFLRVSSMNAQGRHSKPACRQLDKLWRTCGKPVYGERTKHRGSAPAGLDRHHGCFESFQRLNRFPCCTGSVVARHELRSRVQVPCVCTSSCEEQEDGPGDILAAPEHRLGESDRLRQDLAPGLGGKRRGGSCFQSIAFGMLPGRTGWEEEAQLQ